MQFTRNALSPLTLPSLFIEYLAGIIKLFKNVSNKNSSAEVTQVGCVTSANIPSNHNKKNTIPKPQSIFLVVVTNYNIPERKIHCYHSASNSNFFRFTAE
jgi:hypothetical protein